MQLCTCIFTNMKRTTKYRLFLASMVFAFMWVIIGDLVSMHIHIIYNKDIAHHQPFTKTHKSDKKSFKVDSKKDSGFVKKLDYSKILSISAQAKFLLRTKDLLYWFVPKLIACNNAKPSKGRAPPC